MAFEDDDGETVVELPDRRSLFIRSEVLRSDCARGQDHEHGHRPQGGSNSFHEPSRLVIVRCRRDPRILRPEVFVSFMADSKLVWTSDPEEAKRLRESGAAPNTKDEDASSQTIRVVLDRKRRAGKSVTVASG